MQRPTGITILAILAFIGGVLALLAGIATIGLGGVAATAGATTSEGGAVAAGGLAVLLGGGVLLLGLLNLVVGYGFWTLKSWAWILGVVSQGISLLFALIAIVQGQGIGSQIFGILISAGILYYLFTPNVKMAFGRA